MKSLNCPSAHDAPHAPCLFRLGIGAALLLGIATSGTAQTLADLPPRPTQQLERWLALDDVGLSALLQSAWPSVQAELNSAAPPDMVLREAPLSFLGPQRTCLQKRSVKACRVHLSDLVRLNRTRGPSAGGAAVNPFGSTPAN